MKSERRWILDGEQAKGTNEPVDDGKGRNHWHDAFYWALQLELYDYRNALHFEDEHRLSEEALKMDALVIKKDRDAVIEKNIGRIFRAYNIFEFKSENDYLSVFDYSKVIGYALIYSAFSKVHIGDMTVSFVVTKHPRNLVRHLRTVRGLRSCIHSVPTPP